VRAFDRRSRRQALATEEEKQYGEFHGDAFALLPLACSSILMPGWNEIVAAPISKGRIGNRTAQSLKVPGANLASTETVEELRAHYPKEHPKNL
jgi:hypothetical protein